MVPQVKPAQAYQIFYNFIKNRPINTPVWYLSDKPPVIYS